MSKEITVSFPYKFGDWVRSVHFPEVAGRVIEQSIDEDQVGWVRLQRCTEGSIDVGTWLKAKETETFEPEIGGFAS